MSFFENIGNAISGAVDNVTGAVSGAVNTVKSKVSGSPVPITDSAPVQAPLTQMAGRRRRKTRKGGKRRATRKNMRRR
jgi:hypothetical protein